MSHPVVRAVFFDAGGTLLRPWPGVGPIYAAVANRHGLAASGDAMTRAFHRAWKQFRASSPPGTLTVSRRDWWRRLVFQAFDSVGWTGSPRARQACFEELYEIFAHADVWQTWPDAADTLRELRARRIHVGVISNWDRRLRPLLKESGLARQLDSITVSCDVGAEKPDGRIFRAALTVAGVHPAEAWHVGDSRTDDVQGAESAGLRGWLIDRDSPGRPGPSVVRDLRDLVKWLDDRGATARRALPAAGRRRFR